MLGVGRLSTGRRVCCWNVVVWEAVPYKSALIDSASADNNLPLFHPLLRPPSTGFGVWLHNVTNATLRFGVRNVIAVHVDTTTVNERELLRYAPCGWGNARGVEAAIMINTPPSPLRQFFPARTYTHTRHCCYCCFCCSSVVVRGRRHHAAHDDDVLHVPPSYPAVGRVRERQCRWPRYCSRWGVELGVKELKTGSGCKTDAVMGGVIRKDVLRIVL